MNGAVVILGALLVGGGLAGCGAQAPAAAPGPAPEVSATDQRTTPTGPAGTPTTPVPAPELTGPTSRTITITVRDGQVSGDTGRVEVPLGTPVTLSVTSDVADEIHLHGYDREATIPAGGTGSISFLADIPGVFEVELHESELQLLQLQVTYP